MKWVLVSNNQAAIQEFHLIKDGECKVVLKYNPLHHSARLNCGRKHHGLFYIEKAGQLSSKIVFKNQYGMEIGSVSNDRQHNNEGMIMLEDKQYHYRSQNTTDSLMEIYENNPMHPLVICGIKPEDAKSENAFSNHALDTENSCFLLGLCWYLFLPVAKETEVEYFA